MHYAFVVTEGVFRRREDARLCMKADMVKHLSGPVLRCCDSWCSGEDVVSLSGVSSLLHHVGIGIGRTSMVCDLSKRKPKDEKDLDKQDLVEFDGLFKTLLFGDTSYMPLVLGSFCGLGGRVVGRKYSKRVRVGEVGMETTDGVALNSAGFESSQRLGAEKDL